MSIILKKVCYRLSRIKHGPSEKAQRATKTSKFSKVNIVYGDQSASEDSVNFLNYKLHRTTMKHFI